MIILIAESKTMRPCDKAVGEGELAKHRPEFDHRAGELMNSLSGLDTNELAHEVGLSLPMAAKLRRMIYDFPDKHNGQKAIEAFTGVVFKAFGWSTLDSSAKQRTCREVRIISSLYGWLRPDDIVKPYRFDFTSHITPDGSTLASLWRHVVTEQLLAQLSEGETEVIDLLPGDASRCIDWRRVGLKATICKVQFREIGPGGNERTPNANNLKTLRGHLLRQIMTRNIEQATQLKGFNSDLYIARQNTGTDGNIIFDTATI